MRTRSRDGRSYAALGITLALCAAITFFHRQATRKAHADPITYVLRSVVLAPTLHMSESFIAWDHAALISPFEGTRMARENQRLRQQVSRLAIENQSLRQDELAANQMRQMLGLPQRQAWHVRPATVIALKPSPNRDNALLSLRNAGVARQKDVVICSDGSLLGQVVLVTGSTCEVLLITDPLSSVGARVVAEGRPAPPKTVVGICQGARGNALSLVDLPGDADVQVGDMVETSGLGSIFPAGVPIGTVKAVKVDTARSLKIASVEVVSDFNQVQEVFLRQ